MHEHELTETQLREFASVIQQVPQAIQRLVGYAEGRGIAPDVEWRLVLDAGHLELVTKDNDG